jgi:hypothetical protein
VDLPCSRRFHPRSQQFWSWALADRDAKLIAQSKSEPKRNCDGVPNPQAHADALSNGEADPNAMPNRYEESLSDDHIR